MVTIYRAGDSTAAQNSIATWPQTGIEQEFERFVNVSGNKSATPVFIAPLTRWDRSNATGTNANDVAVALLRG